MTDNLLRSSAQRVQEALDQSGIQFTVMELPSSTRTAIEAAQAVGCTVGQIAKSLIFRATSGAPILVIASGANRVDEKKVGAVLGEAIHKADAAFARDQTGYVIGGIPPLGHIQKIHTLIDEDLLQYRVIWAAAGTPYAIFELTPTDLVKITGGIVTTVKVASA